MLTSYIRARPQFMPRIVTLLMDHLVNLEYNRTHDKATSKACKHCRSCAPSAIQSWFLSPIGRDSGVLMAESPIKTYVFVGVGRPSIPVLRPAKPRKKTRFQ
jgi:hypothetical protein